MLQPTTLRFLKNLARNNHKEWLDANRPAYESAKADFITLVEQVLGQLKKKEAALTTLTPKDCIFRINSDVRFSKDKSPYKTNMGASIKAGGKKSLLAGYYIHIEPGGKSFVGGGLYMPDPAALQKVRQEIDYNWDEFSRILRSAAFKKTYGELEKWEGMILAREPKGYEKDNPAIEFLKLKSFVATQPLTDKQLTEANLTR
ncbi:MAG: DUF2461 domain-containing protein, partial [Bacteroidota bacterium]